MERSIVNLSVENVGFTDEQIDAMNKQARFIVDVLEEEKIIIIRPGSTNEIVLDGADWAKEFIEIIRHQSRTLWGKQQFDSEADASDVSRKDTPDKHTEPPPT